MLNPMMSWPMRGSIVMIAGLTLHTITASGGELPTVDPPQPPKQESAPAPGTDQPATSALEEKPPEGADLKEKTSSPLTKPSPVTCHINVPLGSSCFLDECPSFEPAGKSENAAPWAFGKIPIKGNGVLRIPAGEDQWTLECEDRGSRPLPSNSEWLIVQGNLYPPGGGYGEDKCEESCPNRVVPVPPLYVVHEGTTIRFLRYTNGAFVLVTDGAARVESPAAVGVSLMLTSGESIEVQLNGGRWYSERRSGDSARKRWSELRKDQVKRSTETRGPDSPDWILAELSQHAYARDVEAELPYVTGTIRPLREDLMGMALFTAWLAAEAQGRQDVAKAIRGLMYERDSNSAWRQQLEVLSASSPSP